MSHAIRSEAVTAACIETDGADTACIMRGPAKQTA